MVGSGAERHGQRHRPRGAAHRRQHRRPDPARWCEVSRAAIRAALETQLAALSPAWPTAWENAPFTAPTGQPWQRVKLLVAETAPLGMGVNPGEEWTGTLHVTLWSPAGVGPSQVEARAALIRGDRAAGITGLFHHGQALTSGGVQVTILQPHDGPVLDSSQDWYGLPVLVPFLCHLP
nr:phage tail terminator-like protein [Azospirillum lipoferum]